MLLSILLYCIADLQVKLQNERHRSSFKLTGLDCQTLVKALSNHY